MRWEPDISGTSQPTVSLTSPLCTISRARTCVCVWARVWEREKEMEKTKKTTATNTERERGTEGSKSQRTMRPMRGLETREMGKVGNFLSHLTQVMWCCWGCVLWYVFFASRVQMIRNYVPRCPGVHSCSCPHNNSRQHQVLPAFVISVFNTDQFFFFADQ